MYQGKSFYSIQAAPRSIASILEEQVPEKYWREENIHWSSLRHMAIQLSVLMIAFSCVSNLQHCGDMPVCEILGDLAKSDLSKAVAGWDGVAPLLIKEDFSLQVIALLMSGHVETNLDLQETCLLSNRGWSVFLSTFGGADPGYVRKCVRK